LAYKNPTASPLAYLLNQDGRDLIAQQLNTAILGMHCIGHVDAS
jgi:hypothetical protein